MALLTLAGAFFGPFHNLASLACAEQFSSFDSIQEQTKIDRDTLRFVLCDLKRTGLVRTKWVHGEMYKAVIFSTIDDVKRLPWPSKPSDLQLSSACRLAGVAKP